MFRCARVTLASTVCRPCSSSATAFLVASIESEASSANLAPRADNLDRQAPANQTTVGGNDDQQTTVERDEKDLQPIKRLLAKRYCGNRRSRLAPFPLGRHGDGEGDDQCRHDYSPHDDPYRPTRSTTPAPLYCHRTHPCRRETTGPVEQAANVGRTRSIQTHVRTSSGRNSSTTGFVRCPAHRRAPLCARRHPPHRPLRQRVEAGGCAVR